MDDNNVFKYPCPKDHHMTSTQECFSCPTASKCDIYASMLDEERDRELEED